MRIKKGMTVFKAASLCPMALSGKIFSFCLHCPGVRSSWDTSLVSAAEGKAMLTYWSLSRAIYIQFNYTIYRHSVLKKISKFKKRILPCYLIRSYDDKKNSELFCDLQHRIMLQVQHCFCSGFSRKSARGKRDLEVITAAGAVRIDYFACKK
jgi:hypothetical protein